MNAQEFEKCFESRVDLCRRVLIGKGTEYARGKDRLHNFNACAEVEGCLPERALQGMLIKHWQSIRDMIDDLDNGIYHHMPMWEEKIGDALNYLFILRALIEERHKNNLTSGK